MKIGIISAMWLEAQLIHSKMTDVKIHEIASMKYFEGRLGGTEVVLSTCGIGKVNAAIYTQIMIDRFKVDAILHTGIAGSMDKKAGHGAIVIADKLAYHDFKLNVIVEGFVYKEFYETDKALSDIVYSLAGQSALRGLVVTGDAFIDDSARKADIKARFPEALAVEMEGCAIANTACVNGIPLVVVRCISDLADDDAFNDYKGFEERAANIAANLIINTVEKV
ncbi:MAG: 5'-methylthioadenosine/adenosylhomocysteine nucleosidase [Clostridia bacterium]|nr:5'-methylthioadenosine/adenosylhomocysteine nucleosidase [Clostridia bacterium]